MRMFTGLDKAGRLAARQYYIPKDARLVPGPKGGAVYAWTDAGKFYAKAFRGTAAKAEWYYSFRTEEQRQSEIARFHESLTRRAAYKASQDAARKATANPYTVGDIVHTSWGYDQTNVDFFVVTRVSPGCVWVRKIASDYEATGYLCGRTWPAMPIQMVGPETRHVVRGGHFSIDGHGASITQGDTYTSSYA